MGTNSKIKKALSIAIIMVVLLFQSGCSNSTPEAAVKNFFKALKSNMNHASKYLVDGTSLDNLIEDDGKSLKVLQTTFKKLEYEIISVSKDEEEAIVRVKVTTPDLLKITGKATIELFPKLLSSALGDDTESHKLIETYFTDNLSSPHVPLTTSEIDIKLIKDKKAWLIESDGRLINAITGNIGVAYQRIIR